jgi:starvation-inducible DNA-binding protein
MQGASMAETLAPAVQIGISEDDRAAIAQGLSRLLADTFTLYLTTHNFHWNVKGPYFTSLHAMFMEQYTELWNAIDPIAERVRSLGHAAPGGYARFGELTTLPDAPRDPPSATRPWPARPASCSPWPTSAATNPPPTCSRSA